MDFFPEWPWYLLILEGMVLSVFTLMYLPFRVSLSSRLNASFPREASK